MNHSMEKFAGDLSKMWEVARKRTTTSLNLGLVVVVVDAR